MEHRIKYSFFLLFIVLFSMPNNCFGQLGFSQQSVGLLPDIEFVLHKKGGTLEQAEGNGVVWDFSDIEPFSTDTIVFVEEMFEGELYLRGLYDGLQWRWSRECI